MVEQHPKPEKYDSKIALFIGEDRYDKAVLDDGTYVVKDNIMQSHLNYDVMKKMAKSMGITDIRTYYRPTHSGLKLTFRQLQSELALKNEMGGNTLVMVYHNGYGAQVSSGTHILLNDDTKKPFQKVPFMFNIEEYLVKIAKDTNNYVIAFLDCAKFTVPEQVKKDLSDKPIEKSKGNFIMYYGQSMTHNMPGVSPMCNNIPKRCAEIAKQNHGTCNLPLSNIDRMQLMQLKLTVTNSATIEIKHDGNMPEVIEIPKKILEDELAEASKNKNSTKKKAKGIQGELKTADCIYKGEIVNGKAEGYGNLTYISGTKNGDTYEGEFENNMFNGQGKYIYKEGNGKHTYTGEFIDGSMTGKGRMTFKNDDIAEGMFVNGKCNGPGKVWKYSGDIYEGGLRNNFYHGRGKLTYKAGGYYDGDWNDGFATGHGTKLFQSTDLYTGQMKNGKPHGHGECTYKNGNRYVGMWNENTLTGEGTLHYKNGDVYSGEWNRNKRVKGHVKFKDGGEHWATYENEKITGAYKRKYPNGTILEGPVINGKVNGNGSYLFTSGTRWEGNFVNDLLQGEGVKVVNGVRKRVMFKDNKIDREL